MEEAIFILEREKTILQNCLKGWKPESHPDAFKQRNKKLFEIEKAIKLLKNKNPAKPGFVRMKGLEPPRLTTPDPKSGAATNYATSAFPYLRCKDK